ncbi:uncharacterized protein DEA37_0004230 [Paragonimus westermani]|uniref:EF-hand domain-containing protein n=1 Tax=Paragonimus westermani TaxID=34504 RepID=A0A5J4P2F7_9TREM|nr:uncharacterized protein DEA37_0004230 [Paragonimus westermani]
MACTHRTNAILQQKSKKKIETATSPLEKLTHICLARGANGIVGIGRQFRIIDDDGNKQLSFKEFYKGCNDFGANLTKEEVTDIFQSIDKDGSGFIDFEEFLKALRPNKLEGFVFKQVDDLRGVYNCKKHPKYLNGEKTEDEIFIEFLRTFQPEDSADDTVQKDEFFNYYAGLSASIDNDAYFDLILRTAYML